MQYFALVNLSFPLEVNAYFRIDLAAQTLFQMKEWGYLQQRIQYTARTLFLQKKGVAIVTKAFFGHPSPSKRQVDQYKLLSE